MFYNSYINSNENQNDTTSPNENKQFSLVKIFPRNFSRCFSLKPSTFARKIVSWITENHQSVNMAKMQIYFPDQNRHYKKRLTAG